ncbi:MAG: class I SAM-dependent methyltransferase [Bacteroidetes bacterium]|nr:class I SAM-dependent methyltransferase [Bacteroidota bacterium]
MEDHKKLKNYVKHESAKASHYNREAKYYDVINEKDSITINSFLENLFNKYKINTILDFTCGTGSQVFWLSKKGFKLIGCDINQKMLQIARKKSEEKLLKIKFVDGDMRTTKLGKFDAVITIFNSIGHLTKTDFKKTLQNIKFNLNPKGLYVFDIFNLNYLLKDDNITKLTIDWFRQINNNTIREIQYSTINSEGILASFDIYHETKRNNSLKISKAFQTLQIYNRQELNEILEEAGFQIINQCDINGEKFIEDETERILTIASKTE